MSKSKDSIYILMAYCIPYVFLAMCGDFMISATWLYVVAFMVMADLGRYCKKTSRILIAVGGNVLSFMTSYLFKLCLATENWNYYFMALKEDK